jgi:hypothetical protein
MASKFRRAARREWRAVKRDMAPRKVFMRVMFGNRDHPTFAKVRHELFGPKVRASISRDRETGKTRSKGVRQGRNGWEKTPKPASKKKQATAAEQRRIDRTVTRLDRRNARTGKPTKTSGGNSRLARDFQQGAGGRMTGSDPTKTGLPTPRQATGLTRLRCDWCRSSGMRPFFDGDGPIKTVIGVVPCNHRWSSKANGPSQKPAGRRDRLLCPPCENTGEQAWRAARDSDGAATVFKRVCPTCQGWILHW